MVAVQERIIRVWSGQIQARVKIAGEGPPLVFLHGAFGLTWDAFLETLAQYHTVYAPEHPGTTPGDPDAIKPLDDLWDLVLYYDELFDWLGLEVPIVVGHSFGGMVASACLVFDYRYLRASDGEPRGQIFPWEQIEDHRNAITYASELPEVDAERLGIWGTSYSGGHVLCVGALDRRVKCVASQVPPIDGWRDLTRLVT
jgi:hypothetical protein